jgi:hypothetical protein
MVWMRDNKSNREEYNNAKRKRLEWSSGFLIEEIII